MSEYNFILNMCIRNVRSNTYVFIYILSYGRVNYKYDGSIKMDSYSGCPAVREKSGKFHTRQKAGNCRGILLWVRENEKCVKRQGILNWSWLWWFHK